MLAIPFSLVGILPAHALLGAFFTATSMIGFIAGAGIVVRNSIILVDFIELRVTDGMSLEDAVVDAGAVRFRPMALTAAAVIVGSAVILFDPIFQGLAISLMAGEVASLLLSRMTVPITYYLTHRRACRSVKGGRHDSRTDAAADCRTIRRRQRAARHVRSPVLPVVHAVRRPEPHPVGIHHWCPMMSLLRRAGVPESARVAPVTGTRVA